MFGDSLKEVLRELREKYPEAKIHLSLLDLIAGWMRDRANWCQYARLIDNGIAFGTSLQSAILNMRDPEDIAKLIEAKDEFLKEIEETLKTKCRLR